MAVVEPFTKTVKKENHTFHVTIVNFDPEKHPDIFNRELAKALLKQYNDGEVSETIRS